MANVILGQVFGLSATPTLTGHDPLRCVTSGVVLEHTQTISYKSVQWLKRYEHFLFVAPPRGQHAPNLLARLGDSWQPKVSDLVLIAFKMTEICNTEHVHS